METQETTNTGSPGNTPDSSG